MGRIVPLLPPLALVVLVVGIALPSAVSGSELRAYLHGAPLLIAAVAYVVYGRRAPAR